MAGGAMLGGASGGGRGPPGGVAGEGGESHLACSLRFLMERVRTGTL